MDNLDHNKPPIEQDKGTTPNQDGAKRPYTPPTVEEFGSVLELTKGVGIGNDDTPGTTISQMAG